MHIDLLKKRYALDAIDLPHQHGAPNVVQIYTLDSEEYQGVENGRRVPQVRHNLWLLGCRLPLRLNNTRVDVIGSLYGQDTDGWQGRKLILHTGTVSAFGQTKLGILILPQAPPAAAPLTPWPERLRTVQTGYAGPALPPPAAAGQLPPGRAPGGASPPCDPKAPIGVQLAIDLLSAAATRGKDGAWIVATLGILGLNVSDKLPPEYPHLALSLLGPALRQLPKVGTPPTAQVQAGWRSSWSPPAAPQPASASAGETIDPITGEVVQLAATPAGTSVLPPAGSPAAAEGDPDDDIPF